MSRLPIGWHRPASIVLLAAVTVVPPCLTSAPAAATPAPAAVRNVTAFDGVWWDLTPLGTVPSAHRDAGVAYDSSRDRLVVVGGNSSDGQTWVQTLTTPRSWTRVALDGFTPATGIDHAVYDAAHDRVVAVNSDMEVWTLDMASPTIWTHVAISPADRPVARAFFAAALDPTRNRLLVFGGGPYSGLFNDVWALDLTGTPYWVPISPAGTRPAPRWGAACVFDVAHDRLVVFSGSTDGGYAFTNDVWALGFSGTPQWSALTTSGIGPNPRMLSSAIHDPVGGRMLVVGGYQASDVVEWELTLGPSPTWTALAPLGTRPPQPRWSAGAVYRSSLPQMLIYGGFDGIRGYHDTWALDCERAGLPPAIHSFSPAGGRVGDPVTIVGSNLDGATLVEFDGVSSPVLATTPTAIATAVPAGAHTGPVRVVTPLGETTSEVEFFVGETPRLDSVAPDSGRAGEAVTIRGLHFLGATQVRLGGSPALAFVVESDSAVTVTVDSLARSGPISVTTPAATGVSVFEFHVIPPDPRPHLLSVRDVPGDQGGRVVLSWRASDFDQPRYRVIRGYRVWRRAPATGTLEGREVRRQSELFGPRTSQRSADDLVFWESLTELPAAFLPGYAYVAETLSDSTADGVPRMSFFVQALTADPYLFYNSSPDSGYSVDNLAPPAPTPFVAVFAENSTVLHWLPSRAPDLSHYRLYRGSSAGFTPGPSNFVATLTDTTYTDTAVGSFYKLAAVDVHGNVGRYAVVSPDGATATLATLVTAGYEAGTVRVLWYLSTDDPATLTVYRRTLETDWVAVGTVTQDGSGYVRFEEPGEATGVRYGYRLGVRPTAGPESFSATAWVDLPLDGADMAVRVPNPVVSGDVTVSFAAPAGRTVRVELLDVSGRLVSTHEVAGGLGRQSIALARASSLAPGLYLVRVGLDKPVVMRVAVIR